MKSITLVSILVLVLLVVGCGQKVVCNKPYILVGSECCLDQDDNGICDKDELKEEPRDEVKEKPKEEKEEVSEEELKKKAESLVTKFARDWEAKDYAKLYDYFIPKLKESKSKDGFVYVTGLTEDYTVSIRLDSVNIESDNVAYAYYTADYGLGDVKLPAMKLELVNNEWKVEAFEVFFKEIKDVCDELNLGSQCVYDYSIKFEDITKCKLAGYLVIDCLMEFREKSIFESYVRSLCDELTLGNYKYQCIGMVAGFDDNYQVCEDVSDTNENAYCIWGYARIKKDRSVCEEIDNRKHKELSNARESCWEDAKP